MADLSSKVSNSSGRRTTQAVRYPTADKVKGATHDLSPRGKTLHASDVNLRT